MKNSPSQKLNLSAVYTTHSTMAGIGMGLNVSVAWATGEGLAIAALSAGMLTVPLYAAVVAYRDVRKLISVQNSVNHRLILNQQPGGRRSSSVPDDTAPVG